MTIAAPNSISSTAFNAELGTLSFVSGLHTGTDERTGIASPAFHFVDNVQGMQ
jgi:hypothetical protein